MDVCRITSSDSEGRNLWTTPVGDLWTPREASAKYLAGIVAEQMAGSYFHPSLPEHEGEIILDCGANIGVFARQAIKHGANVVVAIEPSSENAYCFRRNLAAEIRIGKVILVEKALGRHDGELWLDTSNRRNPGSWSVSSVATSHGHRVHLTTVDTIVGDLGLPRVDRIKVDVEGCEVSTMAGAGATLSRFSPSFVLAVEHANEDAAQVVSAIRQMDPVGTRYSFYFGFHRCDDRRRLLPQIVYGVRCQSEENQF
jgi:FkbM family methyltransferase